MGEAQKQVHTYQARQPEDTVLCEVLAEHVETFIAQRETDGKGLPEFVVKELRGYLRCGVLQYGFLRTKCKACDFDRAVPFLCKGRGFCPSCCGKRMAEKAYHLIDNVLPDAPYRQWVLSLPIPLRFWMATNKKLTSKVHQIASKEITAYYTCIAKSKGIENPLPGSITLHLSHRQTKKSVMLSKRSRPRRSSSCAKRDIFKKKAKKFFVQTLISYSRIIPV